MAVKETGKTAHVFEILAQTEDGVVCIGPDLRIREWNLGATRILGHSSGDTRGKTCYEIFQGQDRCGNAVCEKDCPSLTRIRRGEPAPTRDMLARDASGRKVWLSLTTVVPPARYRDECVLVHMFRETALPPELERLVAERIRGERRPSALAVLSSREREVLCLLAEGAGTSQIAHRLCISPATARNHIQHILARLGVSSRLEAVALALRDHAFASELSDDDAWAAT